MVCKLRGVELKAERGVEGERKVREVDAKGAEVLTGQPLVSESEATMNEVGDGSGVKLIVQDGVRGRAGGENSGSQSKRGKVG